MPQLTYLIVGSGWRAEFYGRIAAAYPDLFRAVYYCRSEEKAALMRGRSGLQAFCSVGDCLRLNPDFVVTAVDKAHSAEAAIEWASRGFAVACETPAAPSAEGLKALLGCKQPDGSPARISCMEQYRRYPVLMAGLDAVNAGAIGEPCSAYLSAAHDYHAFSLLKKMLKTEGQGYKLRGESIQSPVTLTDSRKEALYDGREKPAARDILHITFDSGKTAVYDFSGVQYHSYIRSRTLILRGSRGEWNGRTILGLNEANEPVRTLLMPEIPERYRCLDNTALRDLRKVWQNELTLETAQDEFAIASMLLDMGEFIAGGPAPYPLISAAEDTLFWLKAREALASPWETVSVKPLSAFPEDF
ncbi:MAG: gfo/Idh/MocA family oxidoreductase [Lachnospiraceae bacterium]|nr:gfo/Idh/MocA family oxidoreductase [Lachnospiraceae bacterium]